LADPPPPIEPDPDTEHRRFAELALRHSLEAVLVTDVENRVLWANAGFERMFGHSAPGIRGREVSGLLDGPDTDPRARADLRRAMDDRATVTVEIAHYRADGTRIWVEKTLTPIFDETGRHISNMSISRDITRRRDVEDRARSLLIEEEFRQGERKLLSQVSEWLYSTKSMDELLMVASRSLDTLLPEAEGQLFIYANSRDMLDLKAEWGGSDGPDHIEAGDCWALRRGRAYAYGTRAIEFPCSHAACQDTPYFCLPVIAQGDTIGLLHLSFEGLERSGDGSSNAKALLDRRWDLALLCAEQISLAVANVQLRQELTDQSVRDPLTGLWNRRWFLDAAHKEIKRATRTGSELSLISLDVDHFKRFNDHHGHDAGDVVLREVGALMRQMLAHPLAPCRLGGEEFVVLCPDLEHEAALARAETFREAVAALEVPYAKGILPTISVSAGVASLAEGISQVEDMLKTADEALYAAKKAGRNRVVSARRMPPGAAAE
jgi:diguanylate cyclase (GGDEF)-like protein/PAS domain S-box-containing protein